MPHDVIATGNHAEIVEWLEENVSKVFWNRSIIEWKGNGWSMHLYGYNQDFPYQPLKFLIRLDSEKHAILCALRWS